MTYARNSLIALVVAFGPAAAHAQIVPTGPQNRPAIAKTESVKFLFPEQVTVAAGKPSQVALHFRVGDGLHINSHTPSADDLIATEFSIPDGAGVRLANAAYPEGKIISLPFDPATKLSVYTGEFIVNARVVAAAGNHLVQGKLRYQACDQSQCLPPKTIEVPIDVIGK
jgi:Disulphide bond corrector protein DsbC